MSKRVTRVCAKGHVYEVPAPGKRAGCIECRRRTLRETYARGKEKRKKQKEDRKRFNEHDKSNGYPPVLDRRGLSVDDNWAWSILGHTRASQPRLFERSDPP